MDTPIPAAAPQVLSGGGRGCAALGIPHHGLRVTFSSGAAIFVMGSPIEKKKKKEENDIPSKGSGRRCESGANAAGTLT